LPGKVHDAERRCPRERSVPSPRLVHTPSEPSGSQRSPAVSSSRSFAQVAGAILQKQDRGQNPDKDEVPGSSPGRPTTHRRRSECCRQRARRARCRLGPRWGRAPIPAGTSPGPSEATHPAVRLGDDHPGGRAPSPRTPATRRLLPPRAAACIRAHRAAARDGRSPRPAWPGWSLSGQGRPPRPAPRPGGPGPPPTSHGPTRRRRRRPRPGLRDRRSSRRRPGSHRGLHRFWWSGSPGHLDPVPTATA
jgi:hypothetical protein